MSNLVFYSTTSDGYIYYSPGGELTFSTIRSGSGTTAASTYPALYPFLQAGSITDRFIYLSRVITLFDTSAIPDNAVITSVNLLLKPSEILSPTNYLGNDNVHIVTSNPSSTTSLVASDYQTSVYGTTSLGSKSISTYVLNTYGTISLNATGVGAVSKTGITKLGILLGWDFNNSFTGSWGNNWIGGIGFYSADSGTSDQPKLDVTFTLSAFTALTDNFNDNSIDSSKWLTTYGTGGNVQETSGQAKITISTGATRGLNQYYSKDAFDLTSSSVRIEAVTPLPQSTSETYFTVYDVYNRSYQFLLQNGTLNFYISDAAGDGSTTYDSELHRFWRIRGASGTVYWDTSSDGAGWTVRHSIAAPYPIDSMYVRYGAWTPSTSPSPGGIVLFDNFNVDHFVPAISLLGTSTITAVPSVTFKPEIIITGTSTISALGVSLADQRLIEKSYLYKVYDQTNTYLGVWDDVMSDLTYDQEVNSAGSAIQVDLARNSDTKSINLETITTTSGESLTTQDSNNLVAGYESKNKIGPGSNVDVNYRVAVWVFYGEVSEIMTTSGEIITTSDDEPLEANFGAVNGLRKFYGYITKYVSKYGGNETTQVSIASFGRELDQYVLENVADTTVTYSSIDPSTILKDGLDKFTASGGLVDYDTTSVQTTGTVVSYTFRLNTYLEMVKKCLELAPYDWFWYVGLGDNILYFADKPTTVSHTFILGKHIQELNLEYSIEDITNVVYFTGGEATADVSLYKKYTDSASITAYRQGLQRITDNRVTVAASADLISEAEIDREAAPRYRTTITIVDAVYDIESILPGQLIAFRNFGNYIDALTLQIVGISYEPDKVTLQLDKLLPSVNKRVEDLRRNMIEADNQQLPVAPS